MITLGVSFHAGPLPAAPGLAYGRVARYAWGVDYHPVIERRLEEFKEKLGASLVTCSPGRAWTPSRFWNGLLPEGRGWVLWEKYNLIIPGLGSNFFLANLVVNLDLPSDAALPQGCGSCERCADRCPTGALDTPFSLDARLCLAYHTVENRGEIPWPLRVRGGDWLFGCDDCQDVCPFNVRPLESRWPEFSSDRGTGAWVSLAEVLRLKTPEMFRARYAGTALLRAKRAGLVRNACLVAANRGAVDLLRKELTDVLRTDPEPFVRNHAAWALGRARAPWARTVLEAARGTESVVAVRDEIERVLENKE